MLCLCVRVSTDPAVLHDRAGGQEPGELTPPLTKQRANTDSHFNDSSQLEASSKYSTPIQGRPRPVPPKKNASGTEAFGGWDRISLMIEIDVKIHNFLNIFEKYL